MSLAEKFKMACDNVHKMKKKPTDQEMLELYSFYKQATIGDNNINKPDDLKGQAKWDAWNTVKGLSKDEAKSKYVEVYNSLSKKYM